MHYHMNIKCVPDICRILESWVWTSARWRVVL